MIDVIVDGVPEFVNISDIVGAFTNEVKIDGSRIGKVRINRKRRRALVELDEEVVQVVLSVMNDDKQISGAEVKVTVRNYEEYLKNNIRNYAGQFKNLLYLERQEKLVRYRLEMRHLTGEERQALGHALLKMRGRADSFPEKDYFKVKFILQQGESLLPEHKFAIGDLVSVTKDDPLGENSPQGRIIEIEPTALTVEFRGEPPYFVYGRGLRIDLISNDRVYQQSLQYLKLLYLQDRTISERLKGILIGEEEPEWSGWTLEANHYDWLDEDQQKVLLKALQARDLYLIEGGAGTGKSALASEIIRNHLLRGQSALAVGTSVKSRDILAQHLTTLGLKVLKLGDVDLKTAPEYDAICQNLLEIKELQKRRDELTHPGGQWMDGLTYKDVLEKAGTTNRYNGIPGYRLKEMAEWIQLQRKIDLIVNEVRHTQNIIWTRLLENNDILCVTCDEAIHVNQEFDLVLIDDAHMVVEPELLPAYFSGKKIVLLGDRSQVVPNIISVEAKEGGLDKSLFTRLVEELDNEWIGRLDTQHRLNFSLWNSLNSFCPVGDKIEHFSNSSDLALNPWRSGPGAKLLEAETSLVFLDTSRVQIEELRDGEEYCNEIEADLIREFVQTVDIEKMSDRMAILTFYSAQVEMIKKALDGYKPATEDFMQKVIHTVEEFSGCEKDLVLISLVHSNSCGYLGLAGRISTLTTAITRGRQKCVLIGNGDTLSSSPIYKDLIEKIRAKGIVYTL